MQYALLLGSAILTGLPFVYSPLWPLAFVSLIPLLWVLYRTDYLGQALLRGLVFGLVICGFVSSFFFQAAPLDWIDIHGYLKSLPAVGIVWGLTTLYMAVPFSLLFALFVKIKTGGFRDILLFSLPYVFFEYVRMWTFMLGHYGSGGVLEGHLSLGFLGYNIARHPLLRSLSVVGGVYILSFIVVAINCALYIGYVRSQRPIIQKNGAVAITILFLVATSLIPFASPKAESSIKVALIDTYIPPAIGQTVDEAFAVYELHKNLIAEIGTRGENPDIIIFPEDERFLYRAEKLSELDYIKNVFTANPTTLIIDSAPADSPKGHVARTSFQLANGELLGSRDKYFIMPVGEFVPEVVAWLYSAAGYIGLVDRLLDTRSYVHGDHLEAVTHNGVVIGALQCSEALSPSLFRDYVKDHNVDLLVAMSSLAWFHGSTSIEGQNRNIQMVNAASLGRPLVQAGNFAPTIVVDSRGNILYEKSNSPTASILVANVPLSTFSTWYGTYGLLPFTVAGFALFGVALFRRRQRAVYTIDDGKKDTHH